MHEPSVWVTIRRYVVLASKPIPNFDSAWNVLVIVATSVGLPVVIGRDDLQTLIPLFILVFLGLAGYRLQREKDLASVALPIRVDGVFSEKLNVLLDVTNRGRGRLSLGAQVISLVGSNKVPRSVPWGPSGKLREGNPRVGETHQIALGSVTDDARGAHSFWLNALDARPQVVDMVDGEVKAKVLIAGDDS